MPKLTLNYACIVDVMQVEPKPTDNQRKNRKVILHVDEEDLFDMFDQLNPKNIVKYLDMRGIKHREPANLVVKVKPDGTRASELVLGTSLRTSPTISPDGTIYCTGMKDGKPTLFAVKGSATGPANSWSQLGGNPRKSCKAE